MEIEVRDMESVCKHANRDLESTMLTSNFSTVYDILHCGPCASRTRKNYEFSYYMYEGSYGRDDGAVKGVKEGGSLTCPECNCTYIVVIEMVHVDDCYMLQCVCSACNMYFQPVYEFGGWVEGVQD